MLIFPAIDLKDGKCVRLKKGDFSTTHQVAEDPVKTAQLFEKQGARWLHVVDLDGAKEKKPVNSQIVIDIVNNTSLNVEIGGGIRNLETVEYYLNIGVKRVILGSIALKDPSIVKSAIERFGADRIVVGIDAKDGMVAVEGWIDTSTISYLDLAVKMEEIGVKTIIFTDISRDGMLTGPNLEMLYTLKMNTGCEVTASGGICNINDIIDCKNILMDAVICGKSIYSGTLSLTQALEVSRENGKVNLKIETKDDLDRFFKKADLIPAVVQEYGTNEVLMLAYMNQESMYKTLKTGYTWFYSRSRKELWNKGATSGHVQKVISVAGDCDNDTLLVKVIQTGAACHTGAHSCFYNTIWSDDNE